MHIVVTDVLACPRCGGDQGLIVLADRMEGRDVAEGSLGCANCRETYAVRGGTAHLRRGAPPEQAAELAPHSEERALRFAALLGLGEESGTVVVYGASPELVAGIAELLPHALLVGATPSEVDAGGASWALVDDRLPFRLRSLRGLAIAVARPATFVVEAAHRLAPGARVVVDPAAPGLASELRSAGLEVLLDQDGVAVASGGGLR